MTAFAVEIEEGLRQIAGLLDVWRATGVAVDARVHVQAPGRAEFADALAILGPEAERQERAVTASIVRQFGPVRLVVSCWAGYLMPPGGQVGRDPIVWPEPADLSRRPQ